MEDKRNETEMSLGILGIVVGILLLAIFLKGIVFSLPLRTYAAEIIFLLLINIYGAYRLLKATFSSHWENVKIKPIFVSLIVSACFGLVFGISYGVRIAMTYPDGFFQFRGIVEIGIISFFPTLTMFIFLSLVYPKLEERKAQKKNQSKENAGGTD